MPTTVLSGFTFRYLFHFGYCSLLFQKHHGMTMLFWAHGPPESGKPCVCVQCPQQKLGSDIYMLLRYTATIKKNGSGVRPRLWDETVKQKMRDPPMLACLLGWDRCLRRNSVRYQDSDEKPRTEAISQCAKVERLATNKQAQCLHKFLTMINRQL